MTSAKPVRILCLSKALSPITHQMGTVGNESIVNTEPVRTPLGVRSVPVLSGNAIRHRMVRHPAAEHLVDAYELAGTLTKDELNLLYHGGLRRESSTRTSLRRNADIDRVLPIMSLLGACLLDTIRAGSLIAMRAILVCRENAPRIRQLVPTEWQSEADISGLAPARAFVEKWQYVRGDLSTAAKHRLPSDAEAVDGDEKAKKTDTFPFSGTCVIAGSEWLHGFVLPRRNDMELGCLFHSLRQWEAAGATIGGQQSRGHGRLQLGYNVPGDIDVDALVEQYDEHVVASRDEAVALIRSFYAAPATRPKKATKNKGA